MAYRAYIGISHGNPFNPYDEWGVDYKTADFTDALGETPEEALNALMEKLPTVIAEVTAECEAWETKTKADWKESLTPEQFASDPGYHSPRYFARLFLRALEAMDFSAFTMDNISCKQVTFKEKGYQEEVSIMVIDGDDPHSLSSLPVEPDEILPIIKALAA